MEKYLHRIYEYRIKTNKNIADKINETIHYSNFVRNLCIHNKQIVKASESSKDLVNDYIKQYPELKNTDYSALINSLIMLTYEINPKEKIEAKSYITTYSKFMKQNSPFINNSAYLPKVGKVKLYNSVDSKDIGKIERFTIKKKGDNHYFLYVHTIKEIDIPKKELNPNLSIGLDYSISHFAIDSTGQKYDKPNYYMQSFKKIKRKQNELSKKQINSFAYKTIRSQISNEYEKCRRRNMDYLHKKSTELVNNYDFIVVEDLDLRSMSKTHNFAKKMADNSYATFVKMLEYKTEERGKKLIKVGQWFPSSKMCRVCGEIKTDLKLKDRMWTCPKCGVVHDRDVNSAINIKNEGLRMIGLSAG